MRQSMVADTADRETTATTAPHGPHTGAAASPTTTLAHFSVRAPTVTCDAIAGASSGLLYYRTSLLRLQSMAPNHTYTPLRRSGTFAPTVETVTLLLAFCLPIADPHAPSCPLGFSTSSVFSLTEVINISATNGALLSTLTQ